MTLSTDQYTAFEDVVGPENVSADPVILYSYAWRSGLLAGMDSFNPLFEAIVLPVSTEEVQAVVKLCNRFKLSFKPTSTNWGPYNDPTGPGVIKIDLRRMNQILEINEENMYAVVEPYVIGAQLQAECMKRGFNCNMNGAGSNCSAIPIAAHQGFGHFSQSGSYGERNMLALEWVTPEGDIVKLGSLGSQDDWFCGDGPGPSLRGIVRGNVTPLGGFGVFTKAATKIYPWPGPTTFPIKGVSPHYAPDSIPENFMIRFFSFPSMEMLDLAQQKIGESEIAYELMGFNAAMAASNIATSNDEMVQLFEEINQMVDGPCCMVIIAGDSTNDFNYKTKVLHQIAAETDGKSVNKLTDDPKIAGACLWRWIRSTASIREVFRATGSFGGEVGGTDVYRLMADYIVETGKCKDDLIAQDLVYNDGSSPFTQCIEHGHTGHGELLIRYRPSPETLNGLMDFMVKANDIAINQHFGVPGHVFGDEQHDLYGQHVSNYHIWLRKIKKAFDPENRSESSHYISAKDD